MAALVGKDAKVCYGGTTQVVGIGTFSIPGVETEFHEDTEFGDDFKTALAGLKDGGEFSFSGWADITDTTGQDLLRAANVASTNISNALRFYVNNTSYYCPTTTNPLSQVFITNFETSADKSGLVLVSFSGKIWGKFELL